MKRPGTLRRIAHLESLEKADAAARAMISLKKLAIGDVETVRRIAHLESLEKADAAARAMISLKKSFVEDESSETIADALPSEFRERSTMSKRRRRGRI